MLQPGAAAVCCSDKVKHEQAEENDQMFLSACSKQSRLQWRQKACLSMPELFCFVSCQQLLLLGIGVSWPFMLQTLCHVIGALCLWGIHNP